MLDLIDIELGKAISRWDAFYSRASSDPNTRKMCSGCLFCDFSNYLFCCVLLVRFREAQCARRPMIPKEIMNLTLSRVFVSLCFLMVALETIGGPCRQLCKNDPSVGNFASY